MTYSEKKQLYESIMREVSKVVKKSIIEMNSEIFTSKKTNTFQLVMDWIDSVSRKTYEMMKSESVKESLEPDFEVNVSQLINELNYWFSIKDEIIGDEVVIRKGEVVKNVEFFLTPENIELCDVVVYNPEKKFIKLINEFMQKRNYKLSFYKYKEEEGEKFLHIGYSPLENVSVNLNELGVDYIYHLTPTSNVDNILKNGFRLSSRRGDHGPFYENRAFFFFNKAYADDYYSVLAREYNTDKMSRLALPVEDIENVQFFYDPLLVASKAIFTETLITKTENIVRYDYPAIQKYNFIEDYEESIAGYIKEYNERYEK